MTEGRNEGKKEKDGQWWGLGVSGSTGQLLFPSRGCEHIAVPEGSSVDNLCSPHMSERRAVQGSELARSAKQVYDGKTRAVKGEFSYVETPGQREEHGCGGLQAGLTHMSRPALTLHCCSLHFTKRESMRVSVWHTAAKHNRRGPQDGESTRKSQLRSEGIGDV
ncbi:unnamed protein product [Leuciscus chuanchicus]